MCGVLRAPSEVEVCPFPELTKEYVTWVKPYGTTARQGETMRQCRCERCGGDFPMNETLRARDSVLCDACYDQLAAERDSPETDLERQMDPTICANCQRDVGDTDLPRLAGLPVCGACETFFRNRPFPPWIKMAFAAVIVLVVVSLAWNARFFQAYRGVERSFVLIGQGEPVAAAAQMALAAERVPECQDLRVLAAFMEGMALLSQEKCAEALVKLKQCQDRLDPAFGVDTFVLQAQCGAAFDRKDYDGFLVAAEALNEKRPDDCVSRATVASAWACKYAVSGDPACRDRARDYLQRARQVGEGDPWFEEYASRIQYRLHTREIITHDEFYERFPEGWDPQEEE